MRTWGRAFCDSLRKYHRKNTDFCDFCDFLCFSDENLKLQTVEHVPKDTPPQNHDLATQRECETDGADGKIEQK